MTNHTDRVLGLLMAQIPDEQIINATPVRQIVNDLKFALVATALNAIDEEMGPSGEIPETLNKGLQKIAGAQSAVLMILSCIEILRSFELTDTFIEMKDQDLIPEESLQLAADVINFIKERCNE